MNVLRRFQETGYQSCFLIIIEQNRWNMRGTEWNADLFRRQTRPRLHETRVRQQAGLFLSCSSRRWGEFLLDADRFFRDGFMIFKTPRLINFT